MSKSKLNLTLRMKQFDRGLIKTILIVFGVCVSLFFVIYAAMFYAV